jgi:DNA polymerase-3 subunit delta'
VPSRDAPKPRPAARSAARTSRAAAPTDDGAPPVAPRERKPMFFREVRHQDRALSILRRTLASGRTPHALLFDGPDGVGKEMTARALAAKLLCENIPGHVGFQAGLGLGGDAEGDDFEPCGDCRSCRLFAAGTHPDFHLIDRTLHKLHSDPAVRKTKGLYLVVAIIRQFLIERASASPSLGRRRVFVVRDAERMNDEAQNALLKTLEEPPGSACLILVSSAADRLLPTIRSRCQRIPFATLPSAFVQEKLAAAGMDAAQARTLSGLSQGRLGPALLWNQIGMTELVDRAAALLAEDPSRDPERFAKALIELAGEIASRTGKLEKAAAQAAAAAPIGAPVVAVRAAGSTDAAGDTDDGDDDSDDDDTDGSEESASAPKGAGTDALRDALKLSFSILSTVLRDALVYRSLAACGAAPARSDEMRLLSPKLGVVPRLAEAEDERLASRIQAIASAEWMLDRNVAPALACERLAIALGDRLSDAGVR